MRISRFQLIIFAIITLGVYFRFSGLGNMMYSHDEVYTSLRAAGYTGSEAIDAIWVGRVITRDDIQLFLKPSENKNVFDTLSVIARSMPQLSPLYFVCAHYWMRLIGYTPAAMRSLAAFFSLFAVPGMYWLCRELFHSRSVALFSVILISLSPFSILLAHDARQYSLWASVILISSASFLVALRTNKKINWALYSFSIILGVYSHMLFLLVIAAHGLYLITIKDFRLGKRVIRFLIASLCALLALLPWVYQILTHLDIVAERLGWSNTEPSIFQYIQHWLIIFASPFIDLYFGSRNIIPYLLRIPILLLIGYALLFIVINTSKRIWGFLLLLIGFTALPLFLSDMFRGGSLSIQGRYFAVTNVMIIPVMAYLLKEKLSVSKDRLLAQWYVIAALLIVSQVGSTFNVSRADTWWIKKHSWIDPQIGQVLNQASTPLLVVNGLWPTDLGDVLAISTMVDQDVKFMLIQSPDTIELPEGFSNVFWFHQTYWDFIDSENGRQYQVIEEVPYFMWRIYININESGFGTPAKELLP